jgi:hypothetical protein
MQTSELSPKYTKDILQKLYYLSQPRNVILDIAGQPDNVVLHGQSQYPIQIGGVNQSCLPEWTENIRFFFVPVKS